MSDVRQRVERYLAIWNETDPAARRAAVDEVWTGNARYVDPLGVAEGRDAFDAFVGAAQEQFPGLVFRLAGDVDAHHDVARFAWELGPEGGEAVAAGFDVAEFGADGRFERVTGFLDRVPG
ncbi:nuclear transport factor 2 family protein [Actinomadura sp. WMMB 499]|uniref:nuclear transport factor 2 family protein n=1 Tax=Actinomadura sp. WMMB 499 TaxID=1219491 RepID=UPI0012469DB6|nr:nuclear transport factor 2 family protein [Actinomadura sp. WMMB 499]QFG23209.1 nuclear transport factor 2 family protein [Actinomadura sp. WMMB 499]